MIRQASGQFLASAQPLELNYGVREGDERFRDALAAFLSRHYDDLAQLWRRGEYIPMSLDPNLARAAAVGVTVLSPRGPQ